MKAAIVGGGIIGLSTAYYLLKDGWEITIIDQGDFTNNCSYGNLGMIVPSHFVPLSSPGMISQGIKWMFDKKSPFYVHLSANMDLVKWGLKFMKSATQKHVDTSAKYLLDLNLYSKQLYEDLAATPGFDFSLEKKGILMYYKTEKVGEEEIHLAEKGRSMGLDVETLSKQQAQSLEPEIDLDILGAVHYRSDAHLYPNALMTQLIAFLKNAGVKFIANVPVQKFIKEKNIIKKIIIPDSEIDTDMVIIAAGSWLPQVAKLAGEKLLLMPGKGYSFTIDEPLQKLNIPAILCEAKVAITPMNGKMRYGGTMEIGKMNNSINMNRVKGIVESIPKYFSNLNVDLPNQKDIWYGFRPCTPDGLPYIGFSEQTENLLIAGGHVMSGLSLGPASGKIIADLASGNTPAVNIDAFRPSRFS